MHVSQSQPVLEYTQEFLDIINGKHQYFVLNNLYIVKNNHTADFRWILPNKNASMHKLKNKKYEYSKHIYSQNNQLENNDNKIYLTWN